MFIADLDSLSNSSIMMHYFHFVWTAYNNLKLRYYDMICRSLTLGLELSNLSKDTDASSTSVQALSDCCLKTRSAPVVSAKKTLRRCSVWETRSRYVGVENGGGTVGQHVCGWWWGKLVEYVDGRNVAHKLNFKFEFQSMSPSKIVRGR